MARMPDIEAEIKRDWRAAEDRMRHLMHHGAPQPAAQPIAHNENNPTQEEPMSLLAEIKHDAQALAAKFEAVDEAALAKMEAIQANPGLMSLVDAGLAVAHVPPEGFAVAINLLDGLGKLWEPQADQAAPAAPAQ